jgi:hypothetical protein
MANSVDTFSPFPDRLSFFRSMDCLHQTPPFRRPERFFRSLRMGPLLPVLMHCRIYITPTLPPQNVSPSELPEWRRERADDEGTREELHARGQAGVGRTCGAGPESGGRAPGAPSGAEAQAFCGQFAAPFDQLRAGFEVVP